MPIWFQNSAILPMDEAAIAQLLSYNKAAIAQLGERQTEDLEVPGSIPGLGSLRYSNLCSVTLA